MWFLRTSLLAHTAGGSGSNASHRSSGAPNASSHSAAASLDPMDVMKMFGITPQAAASEGFKKTFDSKFQIPKLSARSNQSSTTSTGNNAAPHTTTADDGGKKDALHSSSSAPASTSGHGSYNNTIVHGKPSSSVVSSSLSAADRATDRATDLGTTSGATAGGSVASTTTTMTADAVVTDASKMLTDFFALNNLAMATAAAAAAANANASTVTKYPVSDMHFNKNLQIYKSLSSDSLPRGGNSGGVGGTATDAFRDHQFSTSNPGTPSTSFGNHLNNHQQQQQHNSGHPAAHHLFSHPLASKTPPARPSTSVSPQLNHNHHHQHHHHHPPPPPHHNNAAFATSSSTTLTSMRPPSAPPTSSVSSGPLSAPPLLADQFKTLSADLSADGTVLDFSGQLMARHSKNAPATTSSGGAARKASSGSGGGGGSAASSSSHCHVHIVKSPVPSPLPRSGRSPCITDDDLMEEALIGIGSK